MNLRLATRGGVPVYIAVGGPAVAKHPGRVRDGFICTSGKGEELYTEKLIPAVKEGAAAAGRNVDDIDKMIEIKISYDPDPDLALENTRFWAPLSLTAEQKHSIDDPIEMEKAADALPIEQVAKRWIVASESRRGGGKGRQILRTRTQPPGVPCARARPAALPGAVRETPGNTAAGGRLT